jgi:hypothetical protein
VTFLGGTPNGSGDERTGPVYGTTYWGGTKGVGTFFKLRPHGSSYTESALVAGTTKSGSAQYATWNEISYVPTPGSSGKQPTFTFENYGSPTIYVTNSGVILDQPVPTDPECFKTPICKGNLVLLAELEQVTYPPAGYSSSPFVALQQPPKRILKPAKS